MDNLDVICTLAQTEAKKFKFGDDRLPWFEIENNKVVDNGNHQGHDNADRMGFFCHHLTQHVLSHLPTANTKTRYSIELHDSNSYLDNSYDYSGCMVWAKNKKDKGVVLIPDPYQLSNYGGTLVKDTSVKTTDKIGFYGSTTGSRNPVKNERIQTALWSLDHRDIIDCYITNIVQMSRDTFTSIGDKHERIMHPFIRLDDMLQYKYLLDINGNTTSWNRVPQILNSKSVLFKLKGTDMSWYYPLLHDGTHFVAVNHHNMRSKLAYCRNNPKEMDFIIANANRFVTSFLKPNHANFYLVSLLEEIQHLHGK